MVVILGAGCRTSYDVNAARNRARIIDRPVSAWNPVSAGTNAEIVLTGGLQGVRTLGIHLARLEVESRALRAALEADRRGYFTIDETERIEGLLFRYLACRETLWDLVAYFGSRDRDFGSVEQQTKAFAIALHAAVLLDHYSSRLVLAFLKDPATKAKLNEGHHVYDIAPGSYDALFAAVTSPDNIKALNDAWTLTKTELQSTQSLLARITRDEPAYADLLRETETLYTSARETVEIILAKSAILLPKTANAVRQHGLVREARQVSKEISDNLYVAKGLIYNSISDIKRPMSAPVAFTDEQVSRIKALLQPGDVIFTYTAGYMSNVFLPGLCKHGITYVGSPQARRTAGVLAERLHEATESKRRTLEENLSLGRLPSGYDADVVEAVAEGVIFNSLDYLMKNHINRMVVLRPRISPEQRADALLATFLMLGAQYDFNFDFADATYICCTEVIYRALHKRGGIDFTLVPRLGIQTLCADDIMKYHLRQNTPKFDAILVAEEDPSSKQHRARVQTGADAQSRLREMLAPKPDDGLL